MSERRPGGADRSEGSDRFAWPEGVALDAGDSPLGQLPETGPLADFRAVATVISRPSDPSRPWVMAAGGRVVKAYDLRTFDALDRRRTLAEAETAIAVSDIEGIVTTHRTGVVGNWLAIEMDRLGETVSERLAAIGAGKRAPLPASRWGSLLEEVAATLDELHRRQVIHRDVKPANLLFDRSGERLLLADFSIASKRSRRRREPNETQSLAGTHRYIAPEVFQGRMGYAVDQYALAVTAQDILGDTLTPAAREVLMRATEQDPEDRFASVEDFAVTLRGAIDDDAPRRLSSRLRRVSPKWRHTWSLGATVLVASYLFLIALRIPGMNWAAGLMLPALAAGLTMGMARLLSRLRGKRTQPRLGAADQPWFPVLLFAAVLVGMRPIFANQPSTLGKYVLYGWIGALAISALLGSTPRNAGEWLVRLVRRWERRRQAQRGRPLRWWGGRVAMLAILLAVSWLPAAVGSRWPNDAKQLTAAKVKPLVTIAESRAAMLAGDSRRVCSLMRVTAGAGIVPCREWASIASRWLRHAVEADGAPRLTQVDLPHLDVSFDDGSEEYGAPSWSIWTAEGDRRLVGSFGREDEAGKIWEVEITRKQPEGDLLSIQESYWAYEVVRRGGRWAITSIEICNTSAPGPCARLTQADRPNLAAMIRNGGRG